VFHIYFALGGKGFFDINTKKIKVKQNSYIEVPPKVEYTYTGKMKLLLIMNPPWFKGNEKATRRNPIVK
jgi:mannose-6-phosphate isomerase-like protein (cupin superfamily)